MLVERDEYMKRGTHIGMRTAVKEMEPFIYQIKRNKLAVIDLDQTDQRLATGAHLLSQYQPEDVVVVSRKETGYQPVVQFGETTGATAIYGRFLPGTLTNPQSSNFMEPKIMVITDPVEDQQAIKEARDANIPVVGICNTGNDVAFIDYVIPANNLGKRSIGIMYYLLAAECLRNRGEIESIDSFEYSPDDFTMD